MTLSLRRGRVVSVDREGPTIELTVESGGEQRPAIADPGLTGKVEPGDDVVVNTAALDLGLSSGGFDVVHLNLTRGLGRSSAPGAALKLNYTSLQHTVAPVEARAATASSGPPADLPLPDRVVAVLALHGQLEPVAWAVSLAVPEARVGFVQTPGGALLGSLSRAVRELRGRGLLAGHLTAGAAFGGEGEAVTVAGAIHAGLTTLGWDAAVVGPGPGLVGSESALGHGGLAALDSAHAALALGTRTVLVPRLSSGDPRPRHRPLSHHTATALELLLRPAVLAWPLGVAVPDEHAGAIERHELRAASGNLGLYRAAGLSTHTMGRSIDEDELFFRAALAGGTVLGEEITRVRADRRRGGL